MRVNDNAYMLDLPKKYGIHTTFNISNLIPFIGGTNDEADPLNLKTNPFEEKVDDGKPLAKGSTTRVMT